MKTKKCIKGIILEVNDENIFRVTWAYTENAEKLTEAYLDRVEDGKVIPLEFAQCPKKHNGDKEKSKIYSLRELLKKCRIGKWERRLFWAKYFQTDALNFWLELHEKELRQTVITGFKPCGIDYEDKKAEIIKKCDKVFRLTKKEDFEFFFNEKEHKYLVSECYIKYQGEVFTALRYMFEPVDSIITNLKKANNLI